MKLEIGNLLIIVNVDKTIEYHAITKAYLVTGGYQQTFTTQRLKWIDHLTEIFPVNNGEQKEYRVMKIQKLEYDLEHACGKVKSYLETNYAETNKCVVYKKKIDYINVRKYIDVDSNIELRDINANSNLNFQENGDFKHLLINYKNFICVV